MSVYTSESSLQLSSLRTGFPRLIETLSQLWEGRAVEDALPAEEGGAVKLECQECSKE
jgi:hypothetical protein